MSLLKKIGAVSVAVFVLLCSLAVPAFASSSSSGQLNNVSWNSALLPVITGNVQDTGTTYYTGSNYVIKAGQYYGTQSVYVCYIRPSANSSSEDIWLAINTPSSTNNSIYVTKVNSGGSSSWVNFQTWEALDGLTDYYYSTYSALQFSDNPSSQLQLPVFSSVTAALDSFSAYITGGSVDQPLTLSVPAGNIAYIELPSGVANQITATSSSALDHKSPWTGSNQAWGYASSLPSSSFSVPVSGTSSFTWEKAGGTNIFGTTRSWKFFSLLNSSNKYLVIVNPAYPDDQPTNQAINGTISVSLPHASAYRIYSLSTEWSDGSLVGSWDAQSDSTFEGSFDSDTESWSSTNSATGLPGSPQAGGSTIVGQSSQNIHDWLQTIANSISGFFNGAIGAVSTLVGSASDFVSSFIHLYNWLPGSVLSVLTSAMIIAITIGVIKVFI